MGQLDGKTALVTGASRSIGKAISIAFAKEGASLVLAARDEEKLKITAGVIAENGGVSEVVPTDVRKEEQIENLFKKTMERFGRLAKLTVELRDVPGALAELCKLLGEMGANIMEIRHEREFAGPSIAKVLVHVTVETRGPGHLSELRSALSAAGYV